MSKILELAIENLIARVESLETEITELKKQKSNSSYTPHRDIRASPTQEASEKQIKYIKDLGINIEGKITKLEAKKLIEEGLKRKNKNDNTTPKPKDTKTEVPKETKSSNEEIEELMNEEEKKDDVFDEEGSYL